MGRRSVITLAFVLLVWLGAASAARAAPVDYAAYNRLADAVWAGSGDRCAGRAVVVAAGAIAGDDAVLGAADGVWDGSCRFTVRADLSAYEACVITVHERGHLAGYRPVDPVDAWHDRHGIMATNPADELPDPRQDSGRPPYVPCARLVGVRFTVDQAVDAVARRWPVRSLSCRVAQGRCVGRTASGRRAAWTVGFDDRWAVVAHRR